MIAKLWLIFVVLAANLLFIQCHKVIINDHAYACNLCRIPTKERAANKPDCKQLLSMQSYGMDIAEDLSVGDLFAVQCAEPVTRQDASSNALDAQSEIHDVRRIKLQINAADSISLKRVMSHLEPERHVFMVRKLQLPGQDSDDGDADTGAEAGAGAEWDSDKELTSLVHARISHAEEAALLLRTRSLEVASEQRRKEEKERLELLVAQYHDKAAAAHVARRSKGAKAHGPGGGAAAGDREGIAGEL